jgi:hypothetical protein
MKEERGNNMVQKTSLHLPDGWCGIGFADTVQGKTMPPLPLASELHVMIDTEASYKIGTCKHCVLHETGRPERAWNADGNKALDFEQDRYFTLLGSLGLVLTGSHSYICP